MSGSDSRHGASSVVDRAEIPLLLGRPAAAWALVEADEPFYIREVDIDSAVAQELAHAGLLEHAEYGTDAWRWRTRDGLCAWIRNHVDRPADGCPVADCHAAGVKNLGDGRYTCSDAECDSEFGRATAEAVLDG